MKNLPPLARQSLDLHMFNISIGHTEFTAMESKTAATPKGFLIFRHVYVMAENSDYESLHLLINYQRRVVYSGRLVVSAVQTLHSILDALLGKQLQP